MRIYQIVDYVSSMNGQIVDEFDLKTKFNIGHSTYKQIKRDITVNPLYKDHIKIITIKGEPNHWMCIKK